MLFSKKNKNISYKYIYFYAHTKNIIKHSLEILLVFFLDVFLKFSLNNNNNNSTLDSSTLIGDRGALCGDKNTKSIVK